MKHNWFQQHSQLVLPRPTTRISQRPKISSFCLLQGMFLQSDGLLEIAGVRQPPSERCVHFQPESQRYFPFHENQDSVLGIWVEIETRHKIPTAPNCLWNWKPTECAFRSLLGKDVKLISSLKWTLHFDWNPRIES